MARKPVTINEREFKSQSEAEKFFQRILNKYGAGQTITGHDADMLRALIQRHPHAEQKIGCGIKRFYWDWTETRTRPFWLERIDGSCDHWSAATAIKGSGNSLHQRFYEAGRVAVRSDIDRYISDYFNRFADTSGLAPCQFSGEWVSIYECDVDHVPPMTFKALCDEFITTNNIALSSEMFISGRGRECRIKFADNNLAQRFQDYHTQYSDLRVIRAELNRGLVRRRHG
jgi:hypothetical protein